MHRSNAHVLTAMLLLSAVATAQALRVPGQYPTIAAALAAAGANGRILVAPGTYHENLSWPAVDGIRLIGEGGAAVTILDGSAAGTVIAFGGGLSRATVVEGLTIMNGFLNTSNNRNYGAGVSINGSSPTLRRCRITGNVGDGTSWNYGGGCYITGNSNPRLEGNEIDHNELRNGSWNYGAGVYVGSGAQAEIVGNLIHHNRNLTVSSTSTGRGHGAGIYAGGSVLIASNTIARNTDNTTGWNYGGGVNVASGGTTTICNNTIADNDVTGGIWNNGGGVYVDGGGTATLAGNLITDNVGEGLYRSTGTGGSLTSDWDDVWNNTGGDYGNVTAGPNSTSVDPLYTGVGDYHLQAGSPCIDGMSAANLTAAMDLDVDGDPRRVDGDQDGGAGNGARLDLGADEYTSVRLSVGGTPRLGATFTFDSTSAQPSLCVLAMALRTGNLMLEPYGNLLLSGSLVALGFGVAAPGAPDMVPVSLPNTPALAGVTVHAQSLLLQLPPSPAGAFTNRVTVTVY